jgi:cytochrome c7-like protein/class III cytochrome C family protein
MFEKMVSPLAAAVLAALAAFGGETATIQFSHKKHAASRLECGYCHAVTAAGERERLPSAGKCFLCHRNMAKSTPALRRLSSTPKEAVPFQVTYHRLPDFVSFNHATHTGARIACSDCHEGANADDIPKPGAVLKMKTCVDCHQARGARAACNTCHELGQ